MHHINRTKNELFREIQQIKKKNRQARFKMKPGSKNIATEGKFSKKTDSLVSEFKKNRQARFNMRVRKRRAKMGYDYK
jgi:hypothetical protein